MEGVNPMTYGLQKKGDNTMQTNLLRRDPILEECTDGKDLTNLFKNYPILPFAGTNDASGHSLLKFLYALHRNSPTDSACVNMICDYVIGDGVVIERINDEFIDDGEMEVISNEQKNRFKEVIGLGRIEGNILGLSRKLLSELKVVGNAYLILSLIETNGQRTYEIKAVSQDQAFYMVDKETKKTTDYIAISPKWDEDYLKLNTPLVLRKYPYFVETQKGVLTTIFHTKQGGNIYGRPDSMAATTYKYREFQDADYLIKQTDSAWVGDLIIEVEGGDPENDSELGNAQKMENAFTNKSENPLSFLYMERPKGATPMEVYQVKPNTNEKFYEVAGKMSAQMIIKTHGWSERLLGEAAPSGLSGNSYIDELKTKIPLINNLRKRILFDLNLAIENVMKFMAPEMVGIGINFYSNVLDNIEEQTNENPNTAV